MWPRPPLSSRPRWWCRSPPRRRGAARLGSSGSSRSMWAAEVGHTSVRSPISPRRGPLPRQAFPRWGRVRRPPGSPPRPRSSSTPARHSPLNGATRNPARPSPRASETRVAHILNRPMEKHFDWSSVEPRWRERWRELEVGHADVNSTKPAFVIALPPPNITGALHMGHASTFSIQDTLCRQRRMLGFEVEWCPGTDHAAIATQNVIERQLEEEGTSKEALGRPAFQARVDAWYEEYGGRIIEQMRRMGYTCDWERLRFTLDDRYVHAIRVVFKTLFDEGLVYRGPRIVNWCPYCRSAISDEEIDWREQTDTLYYLKYPVEGGESIT